MSDDDRITELEIALAHQQQELHDLGDVLKQHWALIEKLQREISRLEDTKADAEDGVESGDQKPPHY
jgi:uncharacterized coiled-coil protein SlyX